jgi:hypothetical protein
VPDDAGGELDRDLSDLAAELTDDLRALGEQLPLEGGRPLGHVALRLGLQLLADLPGLLAGLLADAVGLRTCLGQLRAVLLERALRLGLSLLGPLDATLDRVVPLGTAGTPW